MDIAQKVTIIILNWNRPNDTIECLRSLYNISYDLYNIIIVDNGSTDDSVIKIKDYLKHEGLAYKYYKKDSEVNSIFLNKELIILQNNKNYGFAIGNNIGMEFALKYLNPDYILLLNNDTVVKSDFLNILINSMYYHNVGIAGPKIFYHDFKGKKNIIWSSGGIINMWLGKRFTYGYRQADCEKYNNFKYVDFVSGAALLIKKNVINKIGFLDMDYITYTEDIDYCYRAKRAGYKILYVPYSHVWHKVSASSGQEMSSFSLFYIVRNSIIFMKKNAKLYQWPSYLFFSFILYLKRLLLVDKTKKKAMIKGVLSVCRSNSPNQ